MQVTEAAVMTQCAMWFTSADGTDHAVADDAMEAGLAGGNGQFVAVCGAEIWAAPLAQPPGPRCTECVVFARARETLRDLPTRLRKPRPGLLARLLRHHHSPADLGCKAFDVSSSAGSTVHRARHAA